MKFIILLLVLISSTASADTFIIGRMEPLSSERLKEEVVLCQNVKLMEAHRELAIIQLNELQHICELATSNLNAFLQAQNLPTVNNAELNWNVSLLPIDSQYRHLNDKKYRFHNRKIFYDHGKEIIIQGYNNPAIHYIFIRDDIEDPHFDAIFAHELFHAMSAFYGIYTDASTDEKLAVEFTNYLGLGT